MRSESDGLSSTACHLSTSGWFGRYSRFATEPVPTPSETATVGRSANDVLKGLAKRLSLTEDQKSKILPIIIERRQKIQEVWTSSTLFVRQKQGQVRGINEDSDRRINALLTGDQQKAYAALEQERKVQRRIRRTQSEPTAN